MERAACAVTYGTMMNGYADAVCGGGADARNLTGALAHAEAADDEDAYHTACGLIDDVLLMIGGCDGGECATHAVGSQGVSSGAPGASAGGGFGACEAVEGLFAAAPHA